MRIARALALLGIASRRKCEIHVTNGAVKLNGEVVRDLGRQVDLEQDDLVFRGRHLHFQNYVYFILHKPVGYITTAADPHAKKTVFDLLPRTLVSSTHQPGHARQRVFPVGRLDKDSSGLLFFTNDGDLANSLTHPRFGVEKWYHARLDRALDGEDIPKFLKGVWLYEGKAKFEKVESMTPRIVKVMLREGKKREVRRLFAKLGYEVVDLCRVAFGPLLLGNLPPGAGRFLTKSEVESLKKSLPKKA